MEFSQSSRPGEACAATRGPAVKHTNALEEVGNSTLPPMTRQRNDGYEISTDPTRLDIDAVHTWLSTDAYWAVGRSRHAVERSIQASLNFAVLAPDGPQAGYARVVTDLTTFAWLCDVYIDRAHRGRGLGTWLATAVRDHLAPYHLKRILLATADAHQIYSKAGFTAFPNPENLMIHSGGDQSDV